MTVFLATESELRVVEVHTAEVGKTDDVIEFLDYTDVSTRIVR